MPGAWESSGQTELQASTPPHQKTGLQKAGLDNPCILSSEGRRYREVWEGGPLREYVAGEE